MKVAVSAQGPTLSDEIDPRFGRAAYFIIFDTENDEVEVLNNSVNANGFKGAGIQAATLMNDKGVNVLLTGYCGPKAFKVLEAGGVKVAGNITGSISRAITKLQAGYVSFENGPNAEAHW
ncbi:MAG: dinitrogenase iron-molybdenum cofactor biosynthesis protein [Desulfobulbaceae bacterium]|nr:MAG: dinitrogenase iron-molybdenum cofactor biosynthesis protein [Desulfobulbaceae bacterium]